MNRKSFILLSFFLSFLLVNSFFCCYANAATQTLSDKVFLTGEFVQGGVVIGKTVTGSKITFDDLNLLISPAGDFVFGFNRDEPEEVALKVLLPDGEIIATQLRVKKRHYDIQRIDGLPPSKVSPRKLEVLKRIRKEGAQAAQARTLDDNRLDFKQTFIWPTSGRISGVYGSQRVLNGKPRRPHFGVDVAAPTGTDVVAPAAGIITLALDDMFFSGGTIILDHGHGLSSTFLHLSQLLVKVGDVVEQGGLIAKVGATGRVTGAHLDWRMNFFKRRVDPQLLVPAMKDVLN